jgi:hypothetical protein
VQQLWLFGNLWVVLLGLFELLRKRELVQPAEESDEEQQV